MHKYSRVVGTLLIKAIALATKLACLADALGLKISYQVMEKATTYGHYTDNTS